MIRVPFLFLLATVFQRSVVAQIPSEDNFQSDSLPQFVVQQKTAYSLSDKEEAIFLTDASADGLHASTVVKRKGKYKVRYRDYETKAYDKIFDIVISPDDGSIGVTALKGDMTHLIINGKEIGKYLEIMDGPMFSPNGSHSLAFGLKKYKFIPYKPVVIADGKEKEYDGIMVPVREYFSPDGNHFAYVARNGSKSFVVVDGKKQRKYERTGMGPFFSPDSRAVAYSGFRNDTVYVVINSEEHGGYTKVTDFTFGASGEQWAAAVTMNFDAYAVKNGELFGPYKQVWHPRFSPDGSRFAFIARFNDDTFAPVIDGDTLGSYPDVAWVVFSPDGQQYAFQVWLSLDSLNPNQAVVLNGNKQQEFEIIYTNSVEFSPSGKRFRYVAEKDTLVVVAVIDGVVGKSYQRIERFEFSPDENEVAYQAWIDDSNTTVVLNDREGPQFREIGPLSFSKDSQHLAYFALKEDFWYLVIDDLVLNEGYQNFEPIIPKFDESNTIHFFATTDSKTVLKVTVSPRIHDISTY